MDPILRQNNFRDIRHTRHDTVPYRGENAIQAICPMSARALCLARLSASMMLS